jgi:hypothetical protein
MDSVGRRLELMSLNPNYAAEAFDSYGPDAYGDALVGGRRRRRRRTRGGALVGGCDDYMGAGLYGGAPVGGYEDYLGDQHGYEGDHDPAMGGDYYNYHNRWMKFLRTFRRDCQNYGSAAANAKVAALAYPAWLLDNFGKEEYDAYFARRRARLQKKGAGLMYAGGAYVPARVTNHWKPSYYKDYKCPPAYFKYWGDKKAAGYGYDDMYGGASKMILECVRRKRRTTKKKVSRSKPAKKKAKRVSQTPTKKKATRKKKRVSQTPTKKKATRKKKRVPQAATKKKTTRRKRVAQAPTRAAPRRRRTTTSAAYYVPPPPRQTRSAADAAAINETMAAMRPLQTSAYVNAPMPPRIYRPPNRPRPGVNPVTGEPAFVRPPTRRAVPMGYRQRLGVAPRAPAPPPPHMILQPQPIPVPVPIGSGYYY